ncbi:hypothetical protein V6N11_057199 [Hibiscus sabdariffa]
MLPFAIIWSMWRFRNEVVLNNKVIDLIQICFVIKSRLGWWIKAKLPSLLLSIDEFFTDPALVEKRLLNAAVLVTYSVWQPPPVRRLKFNVDGALGVGGNVGGIGGVLRNECGQHLLTFSIRVFIDGGKRFQECRGLDSFSVFVSDTHEWLGCKNC